MTPEIATGRVLVEDNWYDGPVSGIAAIHGAPHRFLRLVDTKEDGYLDSYMLWEIDAAEVALALELYSIFAGWYERWEKGEASTDTHPGVGGISPRFDELRRILEPREKAVPSKAKRARATFEWIEGKSHHARDGPGYTLTFHFRDSEG